MTDRERPRVVIVGAGFAGLWAARALGRSPVEVLLVDRNNYHTLIGFRNRLLVLINWAWDYFLYERAVRFILPLGQKEQCVTAD